MRIYDGTISRATWVADVGSDGSLLELNLQVDHDDGTSTLVVVPILRRTGQIPTQHLADEATPTAQPDTDRDAPV